MESHPSFSVLSALIAKYPRASSSLFQAYNDIVYAQQWHDVEVVDLETCSRGAVKGRKRDTEEVLYVVPCSLSETLSFAWFVSSFMSLRTPETNPPFIFLAITTQDASIVYYKLSQGIVKPPV
ncbi:tRNA intron endonuclease [Gymnopilus junonius]|uniref:tRNA intron endonuclease n=1 Tax=Gymnopilus junonius TaxID=109634 RepID=A0A9P5TK25_GYMJU|nr:tRNA intron endonuclease [Gymnopilus junonius]